MMPGKKPASATPSKKRKMRKLVSPLMNAKIAETMPQVIMTRAIQRRAPTLLRIRLEGDEMRAEHAAKAGTGQDLARFGRHAFLGAVANILRHFCRSLYPRHLGAADHQGIWPIDIAGWVSERRPADRRPCRNGSLGPPFGQDKRPHLARRSSLHRRSRRPHTRRIRRVLGVGCCRTRTRQYRHQLSK